jgi:hypothetical protein
VLPEAEKRITMKNLACCFSLAAFLSIPAFAEQMTVGDLEELCTSTDEVSKTACRFYILGVTEGTSLATSAVAYKSGLFHELKDKPICIPEDLSGAALELVVKMTIGEDLMLFPEDRKLTAVGFLSAVVRKQFPRQKPK